uniref:Orf359 n=1 Tax=Rhizophydium sp. 136 TaxID=60187 RepID=Q950N9_9FUNG|nr:orf359 [Rhizophydium sp. 136]AAK84269.1 orf359 [Rhizophydium sp. 136]
MLKTFSKTPKSENVKILERLSAKDKAYFVGLIDGSGMFHVEKNGIYVKYSLNLNVLRLNLPLLNMLNKKFGNQGVIIHRAKNINGVISSMTSILKFSKKQFLIDVIIPIFDDYPMLITDLAQYKYFKYHLLKGTTKYSDLYLISESCSNLSKSDIVKLPYFIDWLIGFLEVKCFFFTYFTAKNHKSRYEDFVASCEVSLVDNIELLEAIRYVIGVNTNVYLNKKQNKLKISSTIDLIEFIIFLDRAEVKLFGLKRFEYLLFLAKAVKLNKFLEMTINGKIVNHYKFYEADHPNWRSAKMVSLILSNMENSEYLKLPIDNCIDISYLGITMDEFILGDLGNIDVSLVDLTILPRLPKNNQ